MYRLLTKDKKTMRWTETKAVETDVIAQHLYNYIAVQSPKRRSAMLQPLAKTYLADRRTEDPECNPEGELMARLPVDVICAALDSRLDGEEAKPIVLLDAFHEFNGPAFRLVWLRDNGPHETMVVDVMKEDGSGLEQKTFSLPAEGLGYEYVADAIMEYDDAYGTHLKKLAFRSLRIATKYDSFITAADLLNLELDSRL